jgi:hypothetical protein
MSGGVERHAHIVQMERLTIVDSLNRSVGAKPRAQYAMALRLGEIVTGSPARVVAVRVRDDRTIDWLPGVDVEVAGLAVQPSIGETQKHVEI